MALGGWIAASACASAEPVTFSGGADVSGQNYAWTITNHQPIRVVRVEISHYGLGVFDAPEDWDTLETTNLIGPGRPERSGVCVATVGHAGLGIARNDHATFRAQVGPRGARRGIGTVRVFLADGTVCDVPNVEVPCPMTKLERFVPLIGLGAIGVIAVIYQSIRIRFRRKGAGRTSLHHAQ